MPFCSARDHKAGIDSAREKRTDFHVAAQMKPDRIVEACENARTNFFDWPANQIGAAQIPELGLFGATFVHHEFVASAKLTDIAKECVRRERVSERQILSDRVGVELATDSRKTKQWLDLGAKRN